MAKRRLKALIGWTLIQGIFCAGARSALVGKADLAPTRVIFGANSIPIAQPLFPAAQDLALPASAVFAVQNAAAQNEDAVAAPAAAVESGERTPDLQPRLRTDLGLLKRMGEIADAPQRLAEAFTGGRPAARLEEAVPRGVKRLTIGTVRTPADVDRLIPSGRAPALVRDLKENLGQVGPFNVRTYLDARGGTFVGIDLSGRPDLVDRLPEKWVRSSEAALLKKIMLYQSGIRLLMLEEGKSPDVEIGGVVAELKQANDKNSLTYALNKANDQVLEHAERHGLGPGAVFIGLSNETRVPIRNVLSQLNDWQRMPPGAEIPARHYTPETGHWRASRKQTVALAQVHVLAGDDMKTFVRAADGRYHVDYSKGAREAFAPARENGQSRPFTLNALRTDFGGVQQVYGRLRRRSGPRPVATVAAVGYARP